MFVLSSLFGLVTFGIERRSSRAFHWPALWASLLLGTAIVPLLIAVRLMTPEFLVEPVAQLTESISLNNLAWPALVQMPASIVGSFSGSSLMTVATWIYLLGTSLLVLRLVVSRLRVERISSAAREVTLSNGTRVRVTNESCTPFALRQLTNRGKAAIVIPGYLQGLAADDEVDFVIRHEQQHLRRRDDELGLVLRFACCLSWPAPFVWAFLRRWQEATEIHCDAAAAQTYPKENRRRFARILLRVHEQSAQAVRSPIASTLIRNTLRSEKMRLTHLLEAIPPATYARSHQLVMSLVIALAAVLVSASLPPLAVADAVANDEKKAMQFDFVTGGRLTSRFGLVAAPGSSAKQRKHSGIDIAASRGTPLLAPTTGVVTLATELYNGKAAYGKVMVLQIDERTQLLFAHLDGFTAKVGQQVREGDAIAIIGNTGRSTGPHVHVEARVDGDLVDPLQVLKVMQHGGIDRWVSLSD